MLLSRLNFSSELMSCGHWWLAEVNEMLHGILFPCCFVDRVHSCSVLHKSAAGYGSDTGTGADRGCSSQCLCWVYTSTFLNRPRSGSPRRLYSDLSCHIKDCQNAIYYLNFLKNKTVLVRYKCVPNRKTRTETVREEYVYRYIPNINIYIFFFGGGIFILYYMILYYII